MSMKLKCILPLAIAACFAMSAPVTAAVPDEGPKTESEKPVSDTWITTKVKADLLATKDVSGTEIKVETVNGTVKLSGRVPTQAQKEKAVEVATKIKGVVSVDSSGLTVG